MESGGITALISNGDVMVTSRSSVLELDGSGSFDDDVDTSDASYVSSLTYQWSCLETSPSPAPCDGLLTTSTTSKLVLSANTLTSGGNYIFTVVVSNPLGKADSSEITVIVSTTAAASTANFASSTVQLVEADEAAHDRVVNAHEEVMLEATTAVSGKTRLTWSQHQDGSSTSTTLMTLDYFLDTSSVLLVPYRVLEGALSPDVSYTLKLRSDPYDCSGTCAASYTQVSFRVNGVPSIGDFEATPTTGVAGYDGDVFSLFV